MYFSLAATTSGLMRRADETSFSSNHLTYRWTVEVKREGSIKEDEKEQEGGIENLREEIL